MRTLLLLRHAKSSWDDTGRDDHDRPLAPRGDRAAHRIAAHLREAGVSPDVVLCSSARRTCETLDALRPALGPATDVQILPALYGATAREVLERVRAVDAGAHTVLVIGHNPGLHDLAFALAGDGDSHALHQLRTKFPTAALATFDVDGIGWDELSPGGAYLSDLVLPRLLDGG